MGHFLATVNKEAAERVGHESRDDTGLDHLPRVGQIVTYYPRPGDARGGMSEFFMLVTQRREDGWLKGISMFDASDFKDITWIPQRSPTHDFPAWDWLKMTSPSGDDVAGPEAAPALARGTEAELRGALERMDQWVGVLHSQIADLQQHVNNLNALRAKDSGDVDEVAEHLASVGRRVQALEAKGEVSIRKEPRTKAK